MANAAQPFRYSHRHSFVIAHGRVAKSEWGVMRPNDFGVMELLDEIDAELQRRAAAGAPATPLLLSLRPTFARVLDDFCRTGLRRWLAERGLDRPASPVAVWLLAKASASTTTKRLAELADQPMPPAFAKHYARALQRLRLWEPLNQLRRRFPNQPAIARYAEAGRTTPFAARLRRFSANVDQSRAAGVPERSRMPLWLSAHFWRRRPGKTAQAIRGVLDRIHRLVHGA